MNLTLINAAWKWGEPAPYPLHSESGEAEREHESVCWPIHIQECLLITHCARMMPALRS